MHFAKAHLPLAYRSIGKSQSGQVHRSTQISPASSRSVGLHNKQHRIAIMTERIKMRLELSQVFSVLPPSQIRPQHRLGLANVTLSQRATHRNGHWPRPPMTAFSSVTVLSQAWQPQSYDATRFLSFERKTPVLRTNPGRRHLFVLHSQTQCLLIWPTGVVADEQGWRKSAKNQPFLCLST